jgi:F-type H+-transporting ATPase subunit b
MELDWTTFGLEIINFLALLWILKHFLYKPVLATLAERRLGVERTLAAAQQAEAEAASLKSHFESRLADWEQEKAAAHARLDADIALERDRRLAALSQDLAAERERSAAQEAYRQQQLQQELASEAGAGARLFAAKLLASLACPGLEARMLEVLIEKLAELPEPSLAPLKAGPLDGAWRVASAFSLSPGQRLALAQALERRLGAPCRLEFVEEASLLAGVRLSQGAWLLDLSLAGELGVFAGEGDLG